MRLAEHLSARGGADAPLMGIRHEITHECFHCIECVAVRPLTFERIHRSAAIVITPGLCRLASSRTVDMIFAKNSCSRSVQARKPLTPVGILTVCLDVGYQDPDGYLFLCDRKRDMIISGGVNIYPAEIESVLIQMPGVRDCAVFGIPDEEFGEQICAHVEPLPGASIDAMAVCSYLGQHLARYKLPKVVELSASLPREDSGKIFKRKLRAPYWEKAGRSI